MELDQLLGGPVALAIFNAHTGKKSPPSRPVKKTRIRKKVKGLGIVHCTGDGVGEASEGGLGNLAAFACAGLAGCCQPRSRLAAKLVPFQVKLEWNCEHRHHLQEQDARSRQQQKRNPQSRSGSQVSLPRTFREGKGNKTGNCCLQGARTSATRNSCSVSRSTKGGERKGEWRYEICAWKRASYLRDQLSVKQ